MILYRRFPALFLPFELLLKTTGGRTSNLVNFFTIATKKTGFSGSKEQFLPFFSEKKLP